MKLIVGIFGLIWKLYIAVMFIVTAIIFYPFIFPLLFSEKNKIKAFRVFVIWSWTLRILCFYFVKKTWRSPLPDGPYLIIANHASYLDIFLMPSILPNQHFLFLGKSEILKYPLIKTYFKRMNIPVYRGDDRKSAKAMLDAIKEVKKGWSLVIFPEGGIPDYDSPRMATFKNGAFLIAKNTGMPIVPVTFMNNFKLFSDPTQIFGTAYPGISEVIIHNSIPPEIINSLTTDELSSICHETIYKPLRERYTYLRD